MIVTRSLSNSLVARWDSTTGELKIMHLDGRSVSLGMEEQIELIKMIEGIVESKPYG